MPMSFTRFLFEYALNIVFKNNKSAFARRLSIPKPEVYRIQRRFREGGGSAVTTEAVLDMLITEGVSLDEVVTAYKEYLENPVEEEPKEMPCVYHEMLEAFRDEFSQRRDTRRGDDVIHRFLQRSTEYLNQLSNIVCNNNGLADGCAYYKKDGQDGTCPCKAFLEYVSSVVLSMEEVNASRFRP